MKIENYDLFEIFKIFDDVDDEDCLLSFSFYNRSDEPMTSR